MKDHRSPTHRSVQARNGVYTGAVHRRLRVGLIIFACFTTTGLLLFGYRYLEYVSNREHVSAWNPFINELLTGAWTAAILFPFLLRFARRYPISRANAARRLPLHVGALLTFSAAHTSLIWISRTLLYPLAGLGHYDYGIMTARYPMEFFHDVVVYCTSVAMIYLFDREVRAAQLEGKLAAARLENLRLQLQPHFLFNALNTISAVMYEDPRRADAMISRLSDLLRATITDSETQEVPLERELATLELYLDIMRQRFEDKLQVEVDVAPEVRHALVPHLLLQPLVENSIKHGIDPRSHAVTVRVTAGREGADTRVRVRDHGSGLAAGRLRKGTGLSNTAERLEKLYGPGHRLEFENCLDGGLAVTVAVPFHT